MNPTPPTSPPIDATDITRPWLDMTLLAQAAVLLQAIHARLSGQDPWLPPGAESQAPPAHPQGSPNPAPAEDQKPENPGSPTSDHAAPPTTSEEEDEAKGQQDPQASEPKEPTDSASPPPAHGGHGIAGKPSAPATTQAAETSPLDDLSWLDDLLSSLEEDKFREEPTPEALGTLSQDADPKVAPAPDSEPSKPPTPAELEEALRNAGIDLTAPDGVGDITSESIQHLQNLLDRLDRIEKDRPEQLDDTDRRDRIDAAPAQEQQEQKVSAPSPNPDLTAAVSMQELLDQLTLKIKAARLAAHGESPENPTSEGGEGDIPPSLQIPKGMDLADLCGDGSSESLFYKPKDFQKPPAHKITENTWRRLLKILRPSKKGLLHVQKTTWTKVPTRYSSLIDSTPDMMLPATRRAPGPQEKARRALWIYLDTSGSCVPLFSVVHGITREFINRPDMVCRCFSFDNEVRELPVWIGDRPFLGGSYPSNRNTKKNFNITRTFGDNQGGFDCIEQDIQRRIKNGERHPKNVVVISDGMVEFKSRDTLAHPSRWLMLLSREHRQHLTPPGGSFFHISKQFLKDMASDEPKP